MRLGKKKLEIKAESRGRETKGMWLGGEKESKKESRKGKNKTREG